MEKYESSDHAAKLNDTHPSFEFPETTGQRPESDRNRQHKSRRGHSVHHCRFEIRVRGDLEEERCIPQHQRTRCKESREREKQSRRSFLKGAGFGAASLAAAGIAGCSPSSTTTTSEVPADNGNKSASDNVSSASWREAPAQSPRPTSPKLSIATSSLSGSATPAAPPSERRQNRAPR